MELPLLVTHPWVKSLIEFHYPPMELVFADPQDYCLDPYLEGYDTFFYVDFFRLGSGSFRFKEYVAQKKARSVISLHGNPSKFQDIYWLEHLEHEDVVLAYGPQMLDLLREKGIVKKPVICGNYRLEYYLKHKPFFDEHLPFRKKGPIALYAPTWAGKTYSVFSDDYSPFFEVFPEVVDRFSKEYQLIVKIHPHMRVMMPDEVQRVQESYPKVFFLSDYPPIYPLLSQVDVLLGDHSSIYSDFLYFNRPFVPFLSPHQQKEKEKGSYRYAYGERKPLECLKEEITHACRSASHGS